jgi:hypothetical protein
VPAHNNSAWRYTFANQRDVGRFSAWFVARFWWGMSHKRAVAAQERRGKDACEKPVEYSM